MSLAEFYLNRTGDLTGEQVKAVLYDLHSRLRRLEKYLDWAMWAVGATAASIIMSRIEPILALLGLD